MHIIEKEVEYLSGRGVFISEHMGKSWDDIDSEANQEGTHSGIDGPKEGEYDG